MSQPWPATATSPRSGTPSSSAARPGYPHELVVDLGSPRKVEGLLYVPRQDISNGRVRDFEIRISADGRSGAARRLGQLGRTTRRLKYVALAGPRARYRPASRPERGRRPTRHERGRGLGGSLPTQGNAQVEVGFRRPLRQRKSASTLPAVSQCSSAK